MAASASPAPAWNIRSCAKCGNRSLATGAKSLVTQDGTPVCLHKFCLLCRDKVEAQKQGWLLNGRGCTECEAPFAKLMDAAFPSGDATEFFRHVNLGGSGNITQEELSAWIASFFDVSATEAAAVVEQRWDSWDSETRGFLARTVLRRNAKDGVLNPEEFVEAQRFLAGIEKEARRRMAPKRPPNDVEADADAENENPPPTKRKREVQELMAKMQVAGHHSKRREELVAKMKTAGLLSQLKEGDGHVWFKYFDRDSSGTLSKEEVIDAMAETLQEFNMSQQDVRIIVEGVWDIVDHHKTQEIKLGPEFARLREMLLESTRER